MTSPELAVQILVQLPGNVNTVIDRHGGRKNILDYVWPEKPARSCVHSTLLRGPKCGELRHIVYAKEMPQTNANYA